MRVHPFPGVRECPPTIRRGSKVTVALGDDFKAWDREAFKAMLIAMPNDGVTSIILDGARLDELDSADLGLLLSTHKKIGGRASITIAGLSEDLRALFQMTQLSPLFNVPSIDLDGSERRVGGLRLIP